MARLVVLLILTLCTARDIHAFPADGLSRDLSSEWFVYEDNLPVKLDEAAARRHNVINFTVNSSITGRSDLEILSSKQFFVFVNGKLCTENTGRLILNLDSLAEKVTSSMLTFSIYQASIDVHDLRTFIHFSENRLVSDRMIAKQPTFFRDFTISGGLFLLIFLAIILRSNTKLASEYFSLSRIFAMRDALDNQTHVRITNSSNVAFYVFCSLLFSWCLLIVFHNLPSDFYLSRYFQSATFWMTVLQWLRLSAILLMVFLIKSLIIYALSSLFGLRDIAGTHFFNWIRFIILLSGLCSVILFIYFIRSGHEPRVYLVLLTTMVVLLSGWIISVFLKFNNRVEHSFFHLFSYICATEIIPLLISVKVLFN